MIYAPEYYLRFRCIADQCRHSCCIGWEIDIDDETYEKYQCVSGEFGKRLEEQIEVTDGVAHFKLGEKERCPFLNERNLCDIILQLGEPCLCQICSDHPRFYHEYEGRKELGLGLCCEEACRLILTERNPMKLVRIEGEGEELPFFGFRERLFSQLCDRSIPLKQRIKKLGISLPKHSVEEWKTLFLRLEYLDPRWQTLLLDLEEAEMEFSSQWDIPFEQLLIYFLYRHLGEGVYDGRIEERILFSLLGLHFIQLLCANHKRKRGHVSINDFLEYARMYSAEIEYSEENTEVLLDYFSNR